MGGYIGAKTGTLVASASDIRGDISATDTTPEITLKNTTETDADGTRSGKITFKGEQSGGEESVLAQIQGSHDGTADDEKGDLIFKTNDGNDALAPTERLRINSAGDVLVSSPDPSLTITNTTEEDSDGGRESTIVFKGEQSGGELSTLAEIEASHDGTADDEKGDLIFKTNDGNDGASPTERLRIDSDGSIITATLGTNNVHLGEGAGAAIVSGGNNNTAIGTNALTANTTADNNVALGYNAGDATTEGFENVFVGTGSGTTNITGDRNTYVGNNSGELATGDNNTFVGANGSSGGCGGLITTGSKNTILGGFSGNQGGLDIRTSDSNIVLSDGDGNPIIYNQKIDTFQTGGRSNRSAPIYDGQATGWTDSSSINTWTTITAVDFNDGTLISEDSKIEIRVQTINNNASYGYIITSYASFINLGSSVGYHGAVTSTMLNGTRQSELLTTNATHTQATSVDFRMRIANVSGVGKRLQVYSNSLPSGSAANPTLRIYHRRINSL
tara:strand:+ start:2334 stop:3842 length:1509 start_codon:yes stop_codon:yes gene_type:complete